MAKDTFYFPHDYSARNDPKLQKVLAELGHEGLSVFWCLVEMLYENGGRLELSECKSYAFALHTKCELITNLINDYKLFCIDDQFFWSESVVTRLQFREEKSAKARKSADIMWYNKRLKANAERTQSDGNAIKERKGKEIKGKESKEEEESIPVSTVLDLYTPKSEEETPVRTFPFECMQLANLLLERILLNNSKFKKPNLDNWASDIDKLHRIDSYSYEDIRSVIIWCQTAGNFWVPNIRSGNKLREKFDRLLTEMKNDRVKNNGKSNGNSIGTILENSNKLREALEQQQR